MALDNFKTKQDINNIKNDIMLKKSSKEKRLGFLDKQKEKLEKEVRDLEFDGMVYDNLLKNWK
ncbi:hypothetical protein CMO86_05710 [Candidatus Woesearchaeota archaeon]|jgi:hypothetical protein|nr:hypothetical protein [Candidatus Woesearchaeota archaeon]|tara:strand:+ start:1294 stop:1482 length:189 start_codon:yes stop_codon:yes gene_type:complete